MATNIDCSACEDLKEFAPDFTQNGVTNIVCNSLKNDTGFNPTLTTLHTDCDDLDTANDCLIGMMDKEIEAYDVCDWKTFAHRFIPNLHQLTKAEICAICGLWLTAHDLDERVTDLCRLLNNVVTPALTPYGTLPLASTATALSHRCGTPTNKVVRREDDGTLNPYTKASQNIGIAYAKMTVRSCTSEQEQMIEWIAPSHYYYKLASGAVSGDVLWRINKTQAQSVIGISDYLWQQLVESSWTWHESALSPSRQQAWLVITVGKYGDLADDELGVVFWGCNAPNNAIASDQEFAAFNNASARSYRHNV